ncbi:putative HTH OST-type domain-containing protein [Seiridium unicorne]|uniref:HTH OST-type domain-containing protein n=1 Tax=Seiridium unicorne TaxID=138068 RepID=A0ABR2UZX3_9PEZI
MGDQANVKLAVLIDADNAQSSVISFLLAEIAKYGTAHVKRVYGDWTGPNLKGWKEVLLNHSIQPIQQFAYTRGKNATDAAMVIDAMDLLYTNRFDGFCIVSSDSDFTRLASRIRESGLRVYGFGERKTPKPFVAACDKFVYVENLAADRELAPAANRTSHPVPYGLTPTTNLRKDVHLAHLLRAAVTSASGEDEWARLADVGNLITKQVPEFDPRNYGYDKLNGLIAATALFEMDRRIVAEGKPAVMFARVINKRSMEMQPHH